MCYSTEPFYLFIDSLDPDEEESLGRDEWSGEVHVRVVSLGSSRIGVHHIAVVVKKGDVSQSARGDESGHVDQEIRVLVGDGTWTSLDGQ